MTNKIPTFSLLFKFVCLNVLNKWSEIIKKYFLTEKLKYKLSDSDVSTDEVDNTSLLVNIITDWTLLYWLDSRVSYYVHAYTFSIWHFTYRSLFIDNFS